MGTFLIVLLIIVVLGFVWGIGTYNKLIGLIEAINNNKRQIDIQLDRRFKVFQSLIEAVKKYMDYEQTTLKDVVALRNQAQAAKEAGDEKARIAAEEGISRIASGLNVVFEQYPDLKASQNVVQLQEEIVNTENKLSYAKQAYNDGVERYYAKKKSFFEAMLVGLFPDKLDKQFEYWALPEGQIQAHEDYTVKF
ncbi:MULTISPECIES: LemA family protein [Legionella]|uniref:LemA family protein n=1 Tax=Legionella septentrionalis TaxID=2498109 RepID=A0A3S0X020_9GAMM|nr:MULTISPECIES: LemA family protein [Legionella]MCP0913868.1 LemA family protein [Legionella sp. 27cVA30]RUQ85264.1 LemA family protein [Legionella septentrionalis]RUQ98711.1 LemA family protein [Legionella septentrionalis]RUR09916.1 LemA family protein [Legionella septentrionalis]RUR15004.1 LemA family protein [Legionella septentrionalis]